MCMSKILGEWGVRAEVCGSLSFDLHLRNMGRLSIQIATVPLWTDCLRQSEIGSQSLDKGSGVIP